MKKKILAALLCAVVLLSSPLGDTPLTIGAAAYEGEPSAEEITYLDLEYGASTLAAPTASRKSGTITCSEDFTTVELSAAKGTVYYSLNGAKYKKYTSAIKLTKNSTIKAYAQSGSNKSKTVTFKYKLKPKVTGSVKEYESGVKEVKLNTKASGVKFYYTIDGSKPTTSSKAYSDLFGIKLIESCRLRVLAVKPGWKNTTFSQNFTVTMETITPNIPSESSADQFAWYDYVDGATGQLAYIGGDVIKVVFPSVFNGKPVKSVLVDPDYGSRSFTSVVIPNSVTKIDDGAFADCALTSVTIPDSVTSIKGKAFIRCDHLTSVTIPDSVTEIGSHAFYGCSSLKSVTIPNSVTEIRQNAFGDCTSLKSVTLSNSLKYIDASCFWNCTSLKSITIPDSVTTIQSWAFQYCTSLKSITIPNGVKEIRFSAFEGCTSLKSVTISDSVTWIDENAFTGCTSLKSVTIPDSVTRIGAGRYINPMLGVDSDLGAFAGCSCTVTYKGKKYTSADNYEALYTAINGKKPPVEIVEVNLY